MKSEKGNRQFYHLLIFILAGTIVIPLMGCACLFFGNVIQSAVVRAETDRALRAASSFAQEMKSASIFANVLASTPSVRAFLSGDGTRDEQIDEQYALMNLLNIVTPSDAIYRVRMYVPDAKIYAGQHIYFFPNSEIEACEALRDMSAKPLLSGAYFQYYVDSGVTRIISCARLVIAERSVVQSVGAVCLDIKTDTLQKMLEKSLDERLRALSLIGADHCCNGSQSMSQLVGWERTGMNGIGWE